jgi:signal transduction histidine kinase
LTSSQAEALSVMRRAEARLERLIEDLIQFSLAARGEFGVNLQDTQVEQLLRTAAKKFQARAQSQEIKLSVAVPSHLSHVRVDVDKISWVLQQLLDNALKFTHNGGKVLLQAIEENNLICISVTDTGIGIPSERVAEIFEPFHQLDGSATRRYAGTGLGLAMVRRIIEAHGSQIKVRSVPGQGSCFEFNLPAVYEQALA